MADPFAPQMLGTNPLFACHVDGFEAHRDALVAEIERQRAVDPVGDARSVRNGWHSGDRFRECRHPSLGWVLHRCFAYATAALAPRYGAWEGDTLKLRSFWANVLDEGGSHAAHQHAPRHWSGVFYVSVGAPGEDGDRAGWIEFLDPEPVHAHRPRDGELLLFPATLMHRVNEVRSRRMTIAFNFDIESAARACSD